MAEQNIIYPNKPLLIVDRQWRRSRSKRSLHESESFVPSMSKVSVQPFSTGVFRGTTTHVPIRRKKQSKKLLSGAERNVLSDPSSKTWRSPKADKRRLESHYGKPELYKATYLSHLKIEDTFESVEQSKTAIAGNIPQPGSFISDSATALYGGLSIKLEPRFLDLIGYYPTKISHSIHPLQRHLNFEYNPIQTTWLPLAISDNTFLPAILLSCLTHLSPPGVDKDADILREPLFHNLNKRLAKLVLSDGTLASISCLVLIELRSGNAELAAKHLVGVAEAVRLRGGLDALPRSLRMKVYRAVILPAVNQISKPCLPKPVSTQISSLLQKQLEIPATSVFELSGIASALLETLNYISHFTESLSRATEDNLVVDPVEIDEISYGLLYDLLLLDLRSSSKIDNACRIAALYYLKSFVTEDPNDRSGSRLLSKRFHQFMEHIWREITSPHLSFWLHMMGAMLSQNSDECTQAKSRLSTVRKDHDIKTWGHARNWLRHVLWLDGIHDEPALKIWNDLDPVNVT